MQCGPAGFTRFNKVASVEHLPLWQAQEVLRRSTFVGLVSSCGSALHFDEGGVHRGTAESTTSAMMRCGSLTSMNALSMSSQAIVELASCPFVLLHLIKFSATLRIGDLNDYIAPPRLCGFLKANSTRIDKSKNVGKALSKPVQKEPVKISLKDCLACSGCITSAETVMLEETGSR
ncbi:hypothetical protein HAX54_053497 [Datura stramonium]|uniref:Uncharacterized protein n=1 Tax=Datura stramonium TaxID=4076 RepID=A0ABS8T1N8_DATST|nr:hypothetical protein [Datura stramonium]